MKKSYHIIIIRLAALCLITTILLGCNDNSGKQIDKQTPISPSDMTRAIAIDIALNKYKKFAEENSPLNGYPRAIENNRWLLTNWKSWTDGFFAGMLWQLSTVDPNLTEQAERWTLPLEEYATMPSHDLGFIINNSFGKAYRITGDISYLPTIETATNTFSGRYNTAVNAIRSWDFGSYQFPVIIDNMMNLALLFDSAKVLNAEPFYSQAVNHAYTTLNNHVRDNGTSVHLVDFSPTTGEVIKKVTVQGLANNSTWARGQAWGIYGFSLAFIESGEQEFLLAAEKLANYFIDNSPEDNIPYWDFDVNDVSEPRDSSAAAIAAVGLWMLANSTKDQILQEKYNKHSLAIIDSLMSPEYFNQDENFPALLLHATGNKPGSKEIDTSLIYADYYFIEALLMQLDYISLPM